MEFSLLNILLLGLLIGLIILMFRRGGGCCGGHSHSGDSQSKSGDKPSGQKTGCCH